MANKGTLVLLRHGETDYNLQNRMTGWRDIPLNETGEEQARDAGSVISAFHFDKAYSSQLSRTFNTAALALEAAGNQDYLKTPEGEWGIERRFELIGTNMGDFTGRNFKTDPEVVNFGRAFDKPLPGGESDKDIVERVQGFYVEEILPRMERGETVLIVGHSGTVRAFDIVMGFAAPEDEKSRPDKARAPNAAPMVVEFNEGKVTQRYWPGLDLPNEPLPQRPPKAAAPKAATP